MQELGHIFFLFFWDHPSWVTRKYLPAVATTSEPAGGQDPIEAGEVSQIEYADLLLRHLGAVATGPLRLASLQAAAFSATVELDQPLEMPTDSPLQVSEDRRSIRAERTLAVLEALVATAEAPLPDVVPLVGGSYGTVVVSDARRRTLPLSPSLAQRAARGHGLAPWRSQLVSVAAVDGLNCQWSWEDLRAFLGQERHELWEDAAVGGEPRGAIVFAPVADGAAAEVADPTDGLPQVIEGLGPVTVVRCRLAGGALRGAPRGIRVAEPITVDPKSWVFVA